MDYVRLGASGLMVSPVCLGTMMFGDRTDAAHSQRIIDAAREAGVNFIDTADAYAKGESERIVGAAIKAHRRHWILATKAGNVLTRKPVDGGSSRRWLLMACDDSLARLGTDYIDIYYLHRDDSDTPLAETIGAIGDLIRAGKIRYFGVSNFRGWRIAEVMAECEAQGDFAARRSASPTTTCSIASRRSRSCPPAITTASASRPTRPSHAAC